MRALLLLLLLTILAAARIEAAAAATAEQLSCLQLAEKILGKNSPEFLIAAKDSSTDSNTFTTSHIRLTFDWSHIDRLLNRSCVSSYLVEFGPLQQQRSKRESVSGHSQVSPPLKPGTATSYSTSLPDDCLVYSVHLLAVIPQAGQMVKSDTRLFWPAARRTRAESFSDAVMVSWPPVCAHVTKHWSLEVDCSSSNNCSQVLELQGDSPVHIPISAPCALLQLRLYREEGEKELLWTFEDVKTLPRPRFEVLARHTELIVRILQSGCDKEAAVVNWRITHCSHKPKEQQQKDTAEGSGDSDDEDDDVQEEYYYYESDPASQQKCVSEQHVLEDGNEGVVTISGIERCSLYSIDFTPTDSKGETLQPGEQYGTIHSTLCNDGEKEGEGSNFWFEDGKRAGTAIPPVTRTGDDSLVMYILVGLGSFLATATVVTATLWGLIMVRRRRKRRKRTSESSPSPSSSSSAVTSSSADKLPTSSKGSLEEEEDEEEDLALLATTADKRY